MKEFPYSRHSSYEELCNLVKAFEPFDIYPCTIDEEYMNLNTSIADLFGHLCFASTFAHDEEMKILARQQEILSTQVSDRDSEATKSLRQGSVEQQNTSSISLLKATSDADSRALDDLERVPKRPRTSPVLSENLQAVFDMRSLPTGISSPKRKHSGFSQSFESQLGRRRKETIAPIPTSINSTSNGMGGNTGTLPFGTQGCSTAPTLETATSAKTIGIGLLANSQEDVHRGTEALPIEVSDGDLSSQGNEVGGFLLEDMPEPDDIQNPINESQADLETQVTLSDAAFESQSSHPSKAGIRKLQQRKAAYKAAKEPSGIWEVDYGLISSNAHHGEEEIEL